MKRYRSAAGLAFAVVVVLGLAGPASAGEQVLQRQPGRGCEPRCGLLPVRGRLRGRHG